MKTFKDLVFTVHPHAGMAPSWSSLGFRDRAMLFFANGYGVSVITGGYGDDERPYELAVMTSRGICYDTHITDDVLGYLTESDVSKWMVEVQNLAPTTQ
jgi:hypothetical protein